MNAEEARGALERVSYQFYHFQTAIEKIAEDSALASRRAEAWTFAERAAVAADQARIQVLYETGDVARAAASAEAARNRLIDEGNKKAADLARSAADEAGMIGMTPYQRAHQAITNQVRDLREQYLPQKGDLAPYAAPVVNSLGRLAQAADAVSVAFGRLGGVGGGATLGPFTGTGSQLFDSIIRAEGTAKFGDPYNTSLNYVKSPKPLTSMTMNEVMQWGDYLRSSQGLNSSAKGAFQITNTTQRDAMTGLGIPGSAMFSPENQQRMAMWIYQNQGIGAWEGFKSGGSGVAQSVSTVGASIDSLEANKRKLVDANMITDALRATSNEIERQTKLQDAAANTWGKSAGEIAKAVEEQKLYLQFTQQQIEITPQLEEKIQALAAQEGARVQKKQEFEERQKQLIADLDTVRSASKGALSTFLTDLESGKKKSEAFHDALKGVLDSLQSRALDTLTNSLLGPAGKPASGLLGGLFSSLFGVGSHAAGGFVGAASTFSSVPLSAFAGAPHFADGGMVGGARPIIAHDGEFVTSTTATRPSTGHAAATSVTLGKSLDISG